MVRKISSDLNERAKKFLKSNRKEFTRQHETTKRTLVYGVVGTDRVINRKRFSEERIKVPQMQ